MKHRDSNTKFDIIPSMLILFLLFLFLLPQASATTIISNLSTSGFTTSNISLNDSRWTGNGQLALNLRNDSQANMTNLVAYWSMDETTGTIVHNVNTEFGVISSDSFTKTFYYKTKSPLSLSVYDISFKSDCDNVQLSIVNTNNIITMSSPSQCKAYDVRTQIIIPNTLTPDLIYFKLYDILWINKPYTITGISSDNNYLLVTVQSSDMGQFKIMKEESFYEIRQLKDNPRIIIDILSKIDNEIYTLLKEKLNL